MARKITLILALALVASTSAQFGGFGLGDGFGYAGDFGYGGLGGLGYAGGLGLGGVGFADGGLGYAGVVAGPALLYPAHHPQYKYSYGVNDAHTGDNKQASEYRSGALTETQYSQKLVHA